MKESTPKLIVYGATSFTAQNLLPYLENHPESDEFDIILAGRNQAKLDVVNRKLSRSREIVVCDLKDEEAVEEMVKKGKVVLNLAGPYQTHGGEAMVSACSKHGIHLVDLSGEVTFVANMIQKYHFQATQSHACIVNSTGFDSVPSDMTLYLAHKTLKDRYPDMQIVKSTSLFKFKGGVSGGTIATAEAEVMGPKENKAKMGEYATTPRNKQSTTPRLLYYIPGLRKWGGFWFMYPYNRTIVRRSQWLSQQRDAQSVNGATHSNSNEPVYAADFEYAECSGNGTLLNALFVSMISVIGAILFFGSSWTRSILKMFLPSSGGGPSQRALESGWAKITNISTTDSSPPVEVKTTFYGQGDPGYLSTCYMMAEAALSLVIEPPKGTSLPPQAAVGGVLTPASAFGMVLVERLRQSGKFELKSEITPIKASGGKKID